MALKVGSKAPAIKGVNQAGEKIKSSDLKGKKVILYFYPKDSTPTCTVESCNLRDNYKSLTKAGFEVIGVSADDIKSHEKFATKQSLPFTLLADTERELIEAYEAWGEKSMYGKKYMGIIRKTYVIMRKEKSQLLLKR